MMEPMTRGAQGGQVVGIVLSALGAGDDVVNLEEFRVIAAGRLTVVAVAGENKPPGGWRDGGLVSFTGPGDSGVAFR